MFNKNTLKSKTFWTGIASVVTGIGLIVSGDVANGATTVVLGLLAITGRDAISKVQG